MKTLAHRISELLFDYDCIIVPELGGFITNYKPAHIDEHLGMLHPPSKALGFNGSLKNNDGLLANYIAREDQISFENACERIKSEVENCFRSFNEGKRVEFEKVGILYMDSENKIHFDPDESINYLTSSFGLSKFYFPEKSIIEKPIETEREAEEKVAVITPVIPITSEAKTDELTVINPISSTGTSKFKYWAAAILIPIVLYFGLVTWQSDLVKDGTVHETDFNPFKSLKKKDYQMRSPSGLVLKEIEIPPYQAPEKIVADTLESTAKSTVSEVESPVMEESLYASADIASLRYHVINGCFSVQNNAEKQTRRLREKGYSAHIIDKKGNLYRVSQGSFPNKEEALALLRDSRTNENQHSWLLKK